MSGTPVPMGDGRAAAALRPVVERDLDAIVAIERDAFGDPWSRAAFLRLLSDPGVFFTAAWDADGSLAGYVVAWFVRDEGEIGNLAVAAGRRRRDIGAALLGATVAAARAAGVASLYLEVREGNAAARALYSAAGFELVGRRRGYYRRPPEDALVLRLALGSR